MGSSPSNISAIIKIDMKNKKRILISGNRGFIGTALEKKLEELEYEVKGFDIKIHPRAEDIRNESFVKHTIRRFQPDIIIHLAALTGVRESLKIPQDYFETNITGTYYLLKWAEEYKIKKFLFASSSSVYGAHQSPLREDMECNHQLSPYGVSKKAGEMLCRMFVGVPTIVFRPFTVYGGKLEDMRKDMVVYKLIEAGKNGTVFEKYGGGTSIRGYVNVHDLIDGIVKLLDYEPENNFSIFNLGGREKIRLNKLVEIVKKEFPDLKVKQVKMPEVDMMYNYADITKAEKSVGFRPKKKFEEAIRGLCHL